MNLQNSSNSKISLHKTFKFPHINKQMNLISTTRCSSAMTGIKLKGEVEKHNNVAGLICSIRKVLYSNAKQTTFVNKKKKKQKTQLSLGQGHIHTELPKSQYNRIHNGHWRSLFGSHWKRNPSDGFCRGENRSTWNGVKFLNNNSYSFFQMSTCAMLLTFLRELPFECSKMEMFYRKRDS